jgi:hypothetical protein
LPVIGYKENKDDDDDETGISNQCPVVDFAARRKSSLTGT